MKNKLTSIFLIVVGIIIGTSIAQAVNFTYKVYNPQTKASNIAVLGTTGVFDNKYLLTFFNGNGIPLCVVGKVEKKRTVLLGELVSSITLSRNF